jgi:hypothetical protein
VGYVETYFSKAVCSDVHTYSIPFKKPFYFDVDMNIKNVRRISSINKIESM